MRRPRRSRVVDQVGRREVAVASGDQVDDRPARAGRAIAGLAEGRVDGRAGRCPRRDDTQYQYAVSSRALAGRRYPSSHRTFVRLCDPPRTAPDSPPRDRPAARSRGRPMTLEIGSQKVGRIGRRGRGTPMATSLPIGEIGREHLRVPGVLNGRSVRARAAARDARRGSSRASRPRGPWSSSASAVSPAFVVGARTRRAHDHAQCAAGPGRRRSLPRRSSRRARRPSSSRRRRPPVDPGIPSSALSALRQTTAHQPARRHRRRTALPTALAAAKPSSSEIAPILRCHGLDRDRSASGSPRPSADGIRPSPCPADFVAFYAAIAKTADEGLSSSLSSSRAYVAAAEEMLRVVARSRRHRRRLAHAGRLRRPRRCRP